MAYSEERKEKVFNRIIDAIVNDGAKVRDLLKEKWAPSPSTFFKWLDEDDSKAKRYARACEMRAELLFDELMHVVYTPEIGETIKQVQKGSKKEMERTKGDMLGHRKLKADTIKWALSKMNPKKYSDKIDLTTNGENINTATPLVLEDGRNVADLIKELKEEDE